MASIIEIVAKFLNDASKGLKELEGDVDGVNKKNKESKESSDSFTDSLLKQAFAGVSVGAVFGALVSTVKATIDAYGEAELVGAQVEAVLKSTAGAAGMTKTELDDLADSLSKMSGMDDDAIERGEALLLTFTKIGKDAFPAATEAALNMSAAMGTDLQSSIIQVGKALNDPIAGATALQRVGVSLTEQQKEQIKTFQDAGDIYSAQMVVLNELQTEFGGVAEAMGNTTVGSANKLKVAWGNLLETMGEGNASTYRETNDWLTKIVEGLTDHAEHANLVREALLQENSALYTQFQINGVLTPQMEQIVDQYIRAKQYGEAWAGVLENQAGAVTDLATAVSEYVPNFEQMLSLTTRISDETEKYNEKQTDLATKQAEIKTQIDELIAQGWSPLSQKVQDLQADYDNLGLKSQELAAKHNEAMAKMQYDLLLTKLSADGLTDAEFKIAQQVGLTTGVFDQASVNQALAMDRVSQAVVDGKLKVQDMDKALRMMADKGYTIDVVLSILQDVAGFNQGHEARTPYGGGYAAGGITTGPQSGHIELLHGTEAVIPLQGGAIPVEIRGMGGGGNIYQISLSISSPITIMDEEHAKNALLPLIIEGVHQAEAIGAL
jgi:tail length tape measure protein